MTAVLMSVQNGLFGRLAIFTDDETAVQTLAVQGPLARQRGSRQQPPPPRARNARSPAPGTARAAVVTLQGSRGARRPPPPRGASAEAAKPWRSARSPPAVQTSTDAISLPPGTVRAPRINSPSGSTAAPRSGGGASAKAAAATRWGVLFDQPTAATGTIFRYTIYGLEYAGEPMRAKGLFYPLLWSNSTGPSNSTGGVTVTPVPGARACL
jgi:hypothetical protein